MKKYFLLTMIATSILLTGCNNSNDNIKTLPESEAVVETETSSEETVVYDESEDLEIDASLLEPFQGEWKLFNSNIKLIINGREVNSIHYDYEKKDEVVNIYTFYFELDESGNLVVSNSYSQPRFTLTILEDGTLSSSSIPADNDEPDIYTYVSDNTTLPVIKDEPSIGMNEEQVKASTWGYPKKRNSTTTKSGTREQWVYDSGYIYLENGIVTAIQE